MNVTFGGHFFKMHARVLCLDLGRITLNNLSFFLEYQVSIYCFGIEEVAGYDAKRLSYWVV